MKGTTAKKRSRRPTERQLLDSLHELVMMNLSLVTALAEKVTGQTVGVRVPAEGVGDVGMRAETWRVTWGEPRRFDPPVG